MRIILLALGIIVLLLVGFLVLSNQTSKNIQETSPQPQTQEQTSSPKTSQAQGYNGALLAGTTSPLLDFTKSDFDKALQSDKIVLLYFYANWCPICRVEVPNALYPAFNELATDKVIGFRVNYNDDQTDADEKALAKELGITYQHTKLVLKNGKQVLKSLDSWDKTQYLKEINTQLN